MKFYAIVMPLLLFALSISKFTGPPSQPGDPIQLRNLSQYLRVTEQPFEMDDANAQLCRPPDWEAVNPHEPKYPQKAFCNVYVLSLIHI